MSWLANLSSIRSPKPVPKGACLSAFKTRLLLDVPATLSDTVDNSSVKRIAAFEDLVPAPYAIQRAWRSVPGGVRSSASTKRGSGKPGPRACGDQVTFHLLVLRQLSNRLDCNSGCGLLRIQMRTDKREAAFQKRKEVSKNREGRLD